MIQESVYRDNTAVLVRGELDIQTRCPAIVDEVWKCLENPNGQLLSMGDMVNLAATEGHSIMAYIAKRLSRPESVLRVESIPMLLRAFDHSYPFTQDVVDALHHQHPFIRTIFHQGWSRPNSGRPSHDDLGIAYAQYGEFLQRIVTPNRREPEWKDDLIWHTHQLMPQQYRVNIVNYIRVFLDHLPRGEDLNGYRPQHDASTGSLEIMSPITATNYRSEARYQVLLGNLSVDGRCRKSASTLPTEATRIVNNSSIPTGPHLFISTPRYRSGGSQEISWNAWNACTFAAVNAFPKIDCGTSRHRRGLNYSRPSMKPKV
ncbi:hypothetical protein BDN71DRAFT_1593266 [Pleurotus eryngii]|uniref:Uncharacterized protein n=1 Tax=Pleurotus eryngii TaxID=5323 RepID=A0A9P6D287_PLEER|nr:hypothetical protein BDN71DRAFT_1593266 [Pleurotus eryngii]